MLGGWAGRLVTTGAVTLLWTAWRPWWHGHDVATWVGPEEVVKERYRRRWIPTHEIYERLVVPCAQAHADIDNRNPEASSIQV